MMLMDGTIRQVWARKKPTKQLMITIPQGIGIKEGDFVMVKKVKVQ